MTKPPARTARDTPEAPPHLAQPERDLWLRIVSEYRFDGSASLSLLGTAMEAHQRARRCREAVDKDGESVRDRFGQVRGHPLLPAERDARAAYLAALRMLNLDITGA